MIITWNLKHQHVQVLCHFDWLLGDLHVVLGRCGPQLGGLVGCTWWGPCYLVSCDFLHGGANCPKGPLKVGMFALVLNAFGIDF